MEVTNKETIFAELKNSCQRAIDWFNAIPSDQFFIRSGEVWSASDNVDHLIKSIKPVVLALKIPKLGLQTMFGKAEHPSKTYDEICEVYVAQLTKGAQASGQYLPNQETPKQSEEKKKELLNQLDKAGNSLISAVEKWQDADLDQYQLPHPILGKLTVREILFFSIYHVLRHARIEGD
jgi:DinB superfamily